MRNACCAFRCIGAIHAAEEGLGATSKRAWTRLFQRHSQAMPWQRPPEAAVTWARQAASVTSLLTTWRGPTSFTTYYSDSAKRTKSMCIQLAWGHTAHRGQARLLLVRARDLIIHGPVHRGANRAAISMDEADQHGHFFFYSPSKGGGRASLCYCA